MNKEQTKNINQLAEIAAKGGQAFTDLYNAIQAEFDSIVENYFTDKHLRGFTFDKADYFSMMGISLWESVKGFDSTKGDFMPRFVFFSNRRMKDVTDINLAQKRFDKSKATVYYDDISDVTVLDMWDKNSCENETEKLVKEFIKQDKDGKVIEILVSTTSSKLRHSLFAKLYGQYGQAERKRVERVRKRLKSYLTSNEVFI